MELDDLKTAWRELDRRVDASQAITLHVLKEGKLDRRDRRCAGCPPCSRSS